MHLHTRNVNTAFRELVQLFKGSHWTEDPAYNPFHKFPVVKRPSRQGNVLMIDEPVIITYSHPRERVLFNSARDANPFFHLYQSLWMLAGRNDVAPLAYYAAKNKDFSDDGKTLNGAYGFRWRHADGYGSKDENDNVDQLDILINHLKADPTSRRAVLQMWNVEDDLLKIGHREYEADGRTPKPYRLASKDVCCNLSVMFALHDGCRDTEGRDESAACRFLDMTVTNRSNDLVWGMLGTDYVDFTILQEYMAARLGAEVGKYHHFTNNLHVYDWNWKPEEWMSGEVLDYRDRLPPGNIRHAAIGKFEPFLLVKDPAVFERELPELVETFAGDSDQALRFEEPFLENVTKPMLTAFRYHKRGETDVALQFASNCTADDWRLAAKGWLERRVK